MLHFHHSYHRIDFPHIIEELKPHRQLQFAPVTESDDELDQAIVNDPIVHDDNWQLTSHPDAKQLGDFWEMVEKDLGQNSDETGFTD